LVNHLQIRSRKIPGVDPTERFNVCVRLHVFVFCSIQYETTRRRNTRSFRWFVSKNNSIADPEKGVAENIIPQNMSQSHQT
jgi:hypothetical protein